MQALPTLPIQFDKSVRFGKSCQVLFYASPFAPLGRLFLTNYSLTNSVMWTWPYNNGLGQDNVFTLNNELHELQQTADTFFDVSTKYMFVMYQRTTVAISIFEITAVLRSVYHKNDNL
jgi:hypothetical protein